MKEINRRRVLVSAARIGLGILGGAYAGRTIAEKCTVPDEEIFPDDFSLELAGRKFMFRRTRLEPLALDESPTGELLNNLGISADFEQDIDFGFRLHDPNLELNLYDDDFLKQYARLDPSLSVVRLNTNGYIGARGNAFINFAALDRNTLPEGSLVTIGYAYGENRYFSLQAESADKIELEKPTGQLGKGKYTILSEIAFVETPFWEDLFKQEPYVVAVLQGIVRIVALNSKTQELLYNDVDLGEIPLPGLKK